MANSIEDHYPIHGQNVCPPKKATMCSEKFMKEYVGLMKLKTPSSGKPCYKVTIGLTCRKTPSSSFRSVPSASAHLT